MNTETVAADVEAPATEAIYAWGAAAADTDEPEADLPQASRSGGVILGVAVLAAIACVVAICTAVVLLTRPTPQPEQHYVIRPPIVEQLPPPPAPKPAPPLSPPVVAAPPVQHAQAPPPDANQRFKPY
jgi:hypothetical protein